NGLNVAETGSSTRDYVRHSVYSWYDGADRLVTTADYGSGDSGGVWKYAAMPAYPGSAPSASDSAKLVTIIGYDSAGRQNTITRDQTDSKTVTNKTLYDDLGRRRYAVANFVNFSWTPLTDSVSNTGGGALDDEDQATGWKYDGLGNVTHIIALDPNADGNT